MATVDLSQYIYSQADIYPTRDGAAKYVVTWNDARAPDDLTIRVSEATLSWWPNGDDDDITTMSVTPPTNGGYREYDIPAEHCARIRLLFTSKQYDSDGSVTESEFWRTITTTLNTDNLLSNSAPQLRYDDGNLIIGELTNGRRVLEFHRTDVPYGGASGITDETALNEMLFTSLVNMEVYPWPNKGYYDLGDSVPFLKRWAAGSYTVGVDFRDSTNRSIISAAIDNALSQINSVVGAFGVSFTRNGGTTGDMSIIVDTENRLYPDHGDGVRGGRWYVWWDGDCNIYRATVELASDFQNYGMYNTYEAVALEEILQAVGCFNDQVEYIGGTTHTDFNYYNKSSSLYSRDRKILQLVYSTLLNSGDTYYDVSKKLNIPHGCFMPTTGEADREISVSASSFLDSGGTYQVRAFIVDSRGRITRASDWITVELKSAVIPWDWSASNGGANASQTQKAYRAVTGNGATTDFPYLVWNDMCAKVREIREAVGGIGAWDTAYGTYTGALMSPSDKTLTASRFNNLKNQIGTQIGTGISDVGQGDTVYGWYFTKLTERMNDWIGRL